MLIVFRQSKDENILLWLTTPQLKKVKKERKKYTHLHICQCRKWFWGYLTDALIVDQTLHCSTQSAVFLLAILNPNFHLQGSVWSHSLSFCPAVKMTCFCVFPISKADKQDFAADHSKMGREKLLWLQTKLPSGNLTQAQGGFVKQIGGGGCSFFCFLLLFLSFSQPGVGVSAVGFSGNFVGVNTDTTFSKKHFV